MSTSTSLPPADGHANGATIRSALRAIVDTMRQGSPDPDVLPDSGFDPTFIERAAPLLEFLWSRYFRVQLRGIENVPSAGAALLVANHSGGLPYDGAMLIYGLHRDHPAHRALRTLVANFAFRSSWMRPVMCRLGGVRASMENALGLLRRDHLVGVFPEGLRGVGKPYRDRYRLAHFGRGGFVRLARTARVPIVPVAIVGAEEIHPVLGKLTRLAQPLGLPYIPITPTFPLLGPLGLLPVPTKWSIHIGEPIEVPPLTADDEDSMVIAEAVRHRMDQMIAGLLVRRRSILFG
jgi:1-acyl-sn-glycerol-3-phosphate acyltransferase